MDTSSKVTVEYRDPSGVFPLISRDITARLPLRNLDWKSQNRPVRQIKALHLDFVPDVLTSKALRPQLQRNDSERNASIDIINGGAIRNAVKERRHQIPGLQTGPYLKIYFLRCDDKDTYKSVERPKLRDWMKECISQKSKGNHDAFEWLIIHVVVPDTLAASEPRWRENATQDAEDLKERPKQGGAKWPGKSKRTVFDKLRADFNDAGKSAQDRIAQIRLPKDTFPIELLPVPPVAHTLKETQEEREKAWNDLLLKIRALTLGSFDQRIKQYEADIAEQDSRRSMPGFNFCTFFIYKEGLAKALESVGLIEDSLVIYDELSLGLESVLRDIANGKAEGTATRFAPFTSDFKERIVGKDSLQANGIDEGGFQETRRTETTETMESEYRDQIVRSEISVFDFFGYLFSRQKTLILRLANARAARAKMGLADASESEDLILISEVCWRAAAFIHNNARILRQDIIADRDFNSVWMSEADIESLVTSWTYDMAERILEETASYAVDQPTAPPVIPPRRESRFVGGYDPGSKSDTDLSAPMARHPRRTTSLAIAKDRIAELQGAAAPLHSASDTELMSPLNEYEAIPASEQPGFAELVTYRASLVMLRRKALELLAKQRGWLAGWGLVRERKKHEMEQVDLNGDDDYTSTSNHNTKSLAASNLLSPALKSALYSEDTYHSAYEDLSDQAMKYYITSTQTKSAESIVGDLAILKYQRQEYEYAVQYFQNVLPRYADDGWSLMELEGLRVYATCLKEMGRMDDYVKTLLQILTNLCALKKEKASPRRQFEVAFDEATELESLLSELVNFSSTLDSEIRYPAESLLSDIRCDTELRHLEHGDGFALQIHLRHLLSTDFELDSIRCRLVNVEDSNLEIWMSSDGPETLTQGSNYIDLQSNAISFGAFLIDILVIQAKSLRFEHDFRPLSKVEEKPFDITEVGSRNKSSEAYKQPWIFLYPGETAFDVEVSLPRDIRLEERRLLDVKVNSGHNHVDTIDLKLKPATAGLRLHLADPQTTNIEVRHDSETVSGQVSLGSLPPKKSALIQIPWSVETESQDMVIRLEAWLHTSNGSFVYLISKKFPTKLPLDVDVRDIFHLDALFSSFTIRTTDQSPLCVTHATLDASSLYKVDEPPAVSTPMMVFEGQPARLIYKITRQFSEQGGKSDAPTLVVQYYNVYDVLSNAFLRSFVQALEKGPFANLRRILTPFLSSRSPILFPNREVGLAFLFSEAKAPSFDAAGWKHIVSTLPSKVQQPLTDWLISWHEEHQALSPDWQIAEDECLRRMIISVDIPLVDFVHKASLSLPKVERFGSVYPQVLVLGEPLKAQLTLVSTQHWSDKLKTHSTGDDSTTAKDKPMNFIYEVHAESDSWLIGGQRRAHFTTRSEEQTFELLLVPLKLGVISLPQVDVHPDRSSIHADDSSPGNDGPQVTCETHYESAGQVVEIIRDLKTSRIYIKESPYQQGHIRTQSRPVTATTVREAG